MTAPLPDDVVQQLQKAITAAAAQPSGVQPLLSLPHLQLDPGVKDKARTVIDDAIKALGFVLQFKWLIPDQYEPGLTSLYTALVKVRGWIG